MRILPRWHSPESVAQTLIAGLKDGSITIDGEPVAYTDVPVRPVLNSVKDSTHQTFFTFRRGRHVCMVSVGRDRNEEAAKKLETYPEIVKVDVDTTDGFVKITLDEAHEDGGFIAERLIAEGFKLKSFSS